MALKLTKPQLDLLKIIHDFRYMPERTRGVGERLEELGLVQNTYMSTNVWLAANAGLEALGLAE